MGKAPSWKSVPAAHTVSFARCKPGVNGFDKSGDAPKTFETMKTANPESHNGRCQSRFRSSAGSFSFER